MKTNRTILFPLNSLLNRYIDSYFVFDFEPDISKEGNVTVPPLGHPVWLIHYGQKGNYYNHEQYTCESMIIGQVTKHILLQPEPGTKLLGINFKPYGLYNLLGISPKSLKNTGIPANMVFSKSELSHIEDQLIISGVNENTIIELESLLLKYQKPIQANDYLDSIVDKIVENNGLINPYELIIDKVSDRSFLRYFMERIGVNPKTFCQILRHKYILGLMYQNPDLKWNDMVLEGYYYDYSHFQKDFIKFTSVKPIDYLALKNDFAKKLIS